MNTDGKRSNGLAAGDGSPAAGIHCPLRDFVARNPVTASIYPISFFLSFFNNKDWVFRGLLDCSVFGL